MGFFEATIADGFQQVAGDPAIAGLMFLGFFLAFVTLQGTRFEGKIVVMLPVLFLSLQFFSFMLVFLVLGAAGITAIAVLRIWNR